MLQPRKHERIDRIANPSSILHRRNGRPLRRDERPMLLVFGPFVDPLSQRLDLLRPQRFSRIGRRHVLIGIVARNPLDQLALRRFAWRDDGFGAVEVADVLPNIEPQVGLRSAASGPWQ